MTALTVISPKTIIKQNLFQICF